ncbi:hypothetical protein F2A38_17910 [Pseudomonas chlororaphis]|uniref:Secreted protein n=1 Tax=Pseudomonas chlororaphis TaxID=587753 RepID=A0AB34C1U0_9PSED|nr:hypothetical protein F2A38_17910 [Pseudomonas chlororaphis]
MPLRTAFAALRFPRSGPAPWAAATGHPWPGAANSASLPSCPLRRTSTRPPDGAGGSRSKTKPKPKHSKSKG